MQTWYGHDAPELTNEQQTISAALIWLLKGDAGQRAIASWSLGWDAAQQASGTDWIAPTLSHALNDPYDAVRFIARRSIRSLPGFDQFEVNAIGTSQERSKAIQRVQDTWRKVSQQKQDPSLLLNDTGLDQQKLQQLLLQRDETPIDLLE